MQHDPQTQLVSHQPALDALPESHDERQRIAVDLSNSGVACLELGDYNAAVQALSRSLKYCHHIMDEAKDSVAPINTTLDTCLQASQTAKAQVPTSSCERYLYQQAARIPLNVGSNYRAAVLVSTLVTFNLALAYQLMSTYKAAEPSQAQILLMKAVKLYELAFGMQQEEGFDNNALFTLATVNNLGLIHSQLNDRTAANQCFQYLLSTLLYLNNDSSHGNELFEAFYRNASSMIPKSESAPAA